MSFRNWLHNTPIGVGLIVALSLAGMGLANQYRQSQGAQQHAEKQLSDTKSGIAQTPIPPITVSKTPPPKIDPERDEWREEQDLKAQKEMADWAWFMMWASFASVGVTGVGVWFVKHTLDATRAAIGEAEKATKAAQDAVEITRKTGESQLRAYVHAGKIRISKVSAVDHVRIDITIRNYGQTPAYELSFEGNVQFRPIDTPPTDVHVSDDPIEMVLAPGGELAPRIPFDGCMSVTQIEQIQDGTHAVFVWGEIHYADAFGERRFTKIRRMYDARAAAYGEGRLTICPEGNEAD